MRDSGVFMSVLFIGYVFFVIVVGGLTNEQMQNDHEYRMAQLACERSAQKGAEE